LVLHRSYLSPRRTLSRTTRYIRALRRDTTALITEFSRPILAFLCVTIIGGFLYGELHQISGRPPIPLIDRPYIMVQLMTLQSSLEVPAEWYLVIFWYLLPPIFIFIVGNGVADFVRLFFNREGRNQWKEAIVETYRNHVIVLGAGHVGLRVIRQLRSLGVEVVAIDNKPYSGVPEELKQMRVPLFMEDGLNPIILQKVGIEHADAFIACTGTDSVNLEACMRVRHMNPAIRLIMRAWDDQFTAQIHDLLQVEVLSSSEISAPVFAGMALDMGFTQTLDVNGEEYSTVRLTVNPGSILQNQTIGTLQDRHQMDIVLHGRTKSAQVKPDKTTRVQAGDTLVIFAQKGRMLEIAARNRKQA
jgi:voltage-gated potassium channel